MFLDAEGVQIRAKVSSTENPRVFSYSELYIGSNGFDEDQLLGSGGFGRVYKAVLPSDSTVVAVKSLAEKGEKFEKTFMAELAAVAHLRHRNLVRLRGWCIHDGLLYLVYDYMPNQSLDRVLFRRRDDDGADSPVITSWDLRKRIVRGLAVALNYLHEQLETQIIHRDVKTSNVMLDSSFNARLGDFGLARWLEHDIDLHYALSEKTPPPMTLKNDRLFRLEETTKIGGTLGYLPPESLQKKSSATAKSDVFSFGIVILEVVTGRRAIDLTRPDDQIVLLDYIRRLSDEGTLAGAGDPRLSQGSSDEDVERYVKIGLMCTLHDQRSRPSMKWVVEALSGHIYGKLPDLPSFRSQPLYISLSSASTTGLSSVVKSSNRTNSSSTSGFYSSHYVSANAETVYLSVESETSRVLPSNDDANNNRLKWNFPVVETPRVVTYEEIVSATENFSDGRRVAEIDFGTAYYGFLENRYPVIVKRLGMRTCPALRMRFTSEFQNLGRLRHRNLMQLRGWCTEQGEMLVVYDYSANRLLSHVLFHQRSTLINWRQRYNVVKYLASAICYLHEEWDEQVIHRNITSSAIILDPDMNPRLGSFALAQFLTRNEQGHHNIESRSVRGIFGYMSPEYVDSGEATTMADVYSFGVVLLEVVTGQNAVDFSQREVLLVKRVHEFEARKKREYGYLVDFRLFGEYDDKELARLVKLGMACTRSDPEKRPSIRQIVSILDGYDQWLVETSQKREKRDEWRQRNASSLCLVRRIQALGIH